MTRCQERRVSKGGAKPLATVGYSHRDDHLSNTPRITHLPSRISDPLEIEERQISVKGELL